MVPVLVFLLALPGTETSSVSSVRHAHLHARHEAHDGHTSPAKKQPSDTVSSALNLECSNLWPHGVTSAQGDANSCLVGILQEMPTIK